MKLGRLLIGSLSLTIKAILNRLRTAGNFATSQEAFAQRGFFPSNFDCKLAFFSNKSQANTTYF
jgi:hypothetical protein